MKILYFAWLRARTGIAAEEVTPPDSVRDVAGLIDWLKSRGPNYAAALANPAAVRAAVNQTHVRFDHALAPGDEVALFPPVTGG